MRAYNFFPTNCCDASIVSRKVPADVPYHHGNLREALIEQGRLALENVGAHELSLRNLARAVGVSEAAPSRHFAGKEGLLAAIAADGWRDLAVMRSEIRDSGDCATTIAYRMLRVYVEFAQQHKGLFDLMVGPRIVARDLYPELNEEASRSFELFASSVEAAASENGWPDETLTLVTHAAWSMEHGLASLILSDRAPHRDRPVRIDHMVHFSIGMFLSAVAAGPAHLERMLALLPAMSPIPGT